MSLLAMNRVLERTNNVIQFHLLTRQTGGGECSGYVPDFPEACVLVLFVFLGVSVVFTLQVILAAVVALAVAAPNHLPPAPAGGYGQGTPAPGYGQETPAPVVKILKDDRSQTPDGTFTLGVEAENGIVLTQSGSPTGPEGAVVSSGQFS